MAEDVLVLISDQVQSRARRQEIKAGLGDVSSALTRQTLVQYGSDPV